MKKKKEDTHQITEIVLPVALFFLVFQKNIFSNSKILKRPLPTKKKKSEVWQEERDETATMSGCKEAFPINSLLPRNFQNFLIPPNAAVLF